jgi:hypothetical protein
LIVGRHVSFWINFNTSRIAPALPGGNLQINAEDAETLGLKKETKWKSASQRFFVAATELSDKVDREWFCSYQLPDQLVPIVR